MVATGATPTALAEPFIIERAGHLTTTSMKYFIRQPLIVSKHLAVFPSFRATDVFSPNRFTSIVRDAGDVINFGTMTINGPECLHTGAPRMWGVIKANMRLGGLSPRKN